jgi:hypothetical protein
MNETTKENKTWIKIQKRQGRTNKFRRKRKWGNSTRE